jgi:hypothetical protein
MTARFGNSSNSEIAIDAHVHVYQPEYVEDVLKAAALNFSLKGGISQQVGVLLLTESGKHDAYGQMSKASQVGSAQFVRTEEAESVWASIDGWRLLIVAGRQITSAEGLEVHAFGTLASIPDGKPTRELIDDLIAKDIVVAFPWAVGKWTGRRGAVVKAALQRIPPECIFLADNRGRPAFWFEPMFKRAASLGVRTLAGTDTLPLPSRHVDVGSYGIALDATLSDSRPYADLKAALRDSNRAIRPFGSLVTPLGFLLDQFQLRLGTRLA